MTNKKNIASIGGYQEEKKEIKELSNLILNRDKLAEIGGKLPHGLMLIGPNGTGKSMLAKCLIEESKCNCVEVNFNDVDNSDDFTGYLKAQFEKARKETPCILYIDEVDKLIGQAVPFFNDNGNSDRSRVLLNELNKCKGVDGLFVLLVSNKKREIDNSILRSGRIDRILEISYPKENERKEIIEVYTSKLKLEPDVDIEKYAKMFKGLTGADIESVINNAVIKSFNEKRDAISNKDIVDAYYDLLFKTSTKDLKMDDDVKRSTCYHEAGHVVLGLLSNPDSVNYASIKPRGGCLGFISQDRAEVSNRTLEEMLSDICVALAGKAAEEIFLNRISEGCGSDLIKARLTVADIVRANAMYGFKYAVPAEDGFPVIPPTSEKAIAAERKEDEILEDYYVLTCNLLREHRKLFEDIADALYANSYLTREDIEKFINDYNLKELDANVYKTIKQRIGLFGRVNYYDIQSNFYCGLYQAKLYLQRLIKDKYVSDVFNRNGYRVEVN